MFNNKQSEIESVYLAPGVSLHTDSKYAERVLLTIQDFTVKLNLVLVKIKRKASKD